MPIDQLSDSEGYTVAHVGIPITSQPGRAQSTDGKMVGGIECLLKFAEQQEAVAPLPPLRSTSWAKTFTLGEVVNPTIVENVVTHGGFQHLKDGFPGLFDRAIKLATGQVTSVNVYSFEVRNPKILDFLQQQGYVAIITKQLTRPLPPTYKALDVGVANAGDPLLVSFQEGRLQGKLEWAVAQRGLAGAPDRVPATHSLTEYVKRGTTIRPSNWKEFIHQFSSLAEAMEADARVRYQYLAGAYATRLMIKDPSVVDQFRGFYHVVTDRPRSPPKAESVGSTSRL